MFIVLNCTQLLFATKQPHWIWNKHLYRQFIQELQNMHSESLHYLKNVFIDNPCPPQVQNCQQLIVKSIWTNKNRESLSYKCENSFLKFASLVKCQAPFIKGVHKCRNTKHLHYEILDLNNWKTLSNVKEIDGCWFHRCLALTNIDSPLIFYSAPRIYVFQTTTVRKCQYAQPSCGVFSFKTKLRNIKLS